MSSPADERPAPKYPEEKRRDHSDDITPASDEGTYVNDGSNFGSGNHLRVNTDAADDQDRFALRSPSAAREQAMRLEDDLAVLEAERVASRSTQEMQEKEGDDARSLSRMRSRRSQNVDEFDEATNPLHEKAAAYNPPENPTTSIAKFIKKLHESSFVLRYFTYIAPVVVILLIPLLVGALAYPNANVGGVKLLWFSVWLEIVWLTLWAGRVRTSSPLPSISPSTLSNALR
jgi:hypothetical protein